MNRILVPAVAWIPMRKPVLRQEWFKAYEVARDKFLAQLGSALRTLSQDVVEVNASIDTPRGEISEWLASRNILSNPKWMEYVHVRASINIDLDELQKNNKGRDLEQKFVNATGAIHLSVLLEQLLVLSELAQPGCLSSAEGVAVSKEEMTCSISGKGTFHSLCFPEENDPIWPSMREFDLTETVKWILPTSFANRALGKTRVERCFAAYTHVISLGNQHVGEVLFRAMQALEAFYCDGNGDLRKQLSDKSAVWLGAWSDKRNIVGHLYDLRSKFVHGASSLEYWPSLRDSWEEDERLMKGFHSGSHFAVRLLVATLQRCIETDVHELSWSYSVATK